jgi:carbon monoxide dehydrogenase subunit G
MADALRPGGGRCVHSRRTLTKSDDRGAYHGTMRVKFGPTIAQFRGEARLAYDHAAQRCLIEGLGIDDRGASRANATGLVEASGTDTTLLKEGTFNVTGPLETFANTGGAHLARALLAEFAEIDTQPRGLWQGLRTADLHIQADARVAAEVVVARLKKKDLRRQGLAQQRGRLENRRDGRKPRPKALYANSRHARSASGYQRARRGYPERLGHHRCRRALFQPRNDTSARPPGWQVPHPDRFRLDRLGLTGRDWDRRGS